MIACLHKLNHILISGQSEFDLDKTGLSVPYDQCPVARTWQCFLTVWKAIYFRGQWYLTSVNNCRVILLKHRYHNP